MLRQTPRFAVGLRLRWDDARGTHVLLAPEAVITLNHSAAEILLLCDGTQSVGEIVSVLQARHDTGTIEHDVQQLLERMIARGWITLSERTS